MERRQSLADRFEPAVEVRCDAERQASQFQRPPALRGARAQTPACRFGEMAPQRSKQRFLVGDIRKYFGDDGLPAAPLSRLVGLAAELDLVELFLPREGRAKSSEYL